MEGLVKSPLNYTGGKYRLLPQILPLFPMGIDTFADIFCGGANVGINVKAERTLYNDRNHHLIELYKTFKKYDHLVICDRIDKIIDQYGLSKSIVNGYSYYGCESGKGLGTFNKVPYMTLREDFNNRKLKDDEYYLMLFTLIIFCFNNQIRFNRNGEFNLPVGKRDFNSNIRRNLNKFIDILHKQNCEFVSKDFRSMKADHFNERDFVYCDPPYLITTASYNESNGWTKNDETNLLAFLDNLNKHKIRFALSNVIRHKGRLNDILVEWAKQYNIHILNFNYNNSNYHSKNNNGTTEEVLITNY